MPAVTGVPAFSDNYIWLIENADATAMVVDPGDAEPVNAALREHNVSLRAVLLTHHHFDHVGGVETLKAEHGCPVYGPLNPAIQTIDHTLGAGDALSIGDYQFEILAVPGHTLDHIAYFQAAAAPTPPLLFCGDTLFAGGCGRIFEGDAPMMFASLQQLAALPAETVVYCAHEYTLANLRFARTADPDNADLLAREQAAIATREAGQPTVPSTLALELATNPFLRSDQEGLRRGLKSAGREIGADPVETFANLRDWKDNF